MTTVGYGDIYPRTTIGRIVYFLCAMFGVVVVSMIVVTVMNMLDMSKAEEKAFTVIKRIGIRKHLRDKASMVLCKAFRMHMQIKKHEPIATREVYDLSNSMSEMRDTLR
jgi:hypothetical protein